MAESQSQLDELLAQSLEEPGVAEAVKYWELIQSTGIQKVVYHPLYVADYATEANPRVS